MNNAIEKKLQIGTLPVEYNESQRRGIMSQINKYKFYFKNIHGVKNIVAFCKFV